MVRNSLLLLFQMFKIYIMILQKCGFNSAKQCEIQSHKEVNETRKTRNNNKLIFERTQRGKTLLLNNCQSHLLE